MMGRSGGMNEAMRQAARLQRKIEQVRAEAKTREVSFATGVVGLALPQPIIVAMQNDANKD